MQKIHETAGGTEQVGMVRRAVRTVFAHSECTIGATTVAVLVLSALS